MPRFTSIVAGRFRLHVRPGHGARFEPWTERHTPPRPRQLGRITPPRYTVVDFADERASIWSALRSRRVVRVGGEAGAGATTLLRSIATTADVDEYPDGVVALRNVRGPAIDVAQRLYARCFDDDEHAYHAGPVVAREFAAWRALVVLDDAVLIERDVEGLVALCPMTRFVIATHASTNEDVTLGALAPSAAVELAQEAYGSALSAEERAAAMLLCEAVGTLPGRVRLIGAIARESHTRFADMLERIVWPGAVFVELAVPFLHALPALERRVLAILALFKFGLREELLEAIVANPIAGVLAALMRRELVSTADGLYVLSSCVEALVPASWKNDELVPRIVDVMREAAIRNAGDPAFEAQLFAGEAFIYAVFHAGRWEEVVRLGPAIADGLALCGAFAAWGRVLDRVAAAAENCGDAAAANFANYQHGLQAVAVSADEFAETPTVFGPMPMVDAAAFARSSGRIEARGAIVRPMVDASTDAPPSATQAAAAPRSAERDPKFDGSELAAADEPPWLDAVVGGVRAAQILMAVIIAAVFVLQREPTVAIDEFSANLTSIRAGGGVLLCAVSSDAASLEVAPGSLRLTPQTRSCVRVYPRRTTTYRLVAVGRDGRRVVRTLTVAVKDRAAPVVSFASRSREPASPAQR